MRKSNYDKRPVVSVPNSAAACVVGWDVIAGRISAAIASRVARKTVVVVECYPGVDEEEVSRELQKYLSSTEGGNGKACSFTVIRSSQAYLPPEKINSLVAPFLGGNDPVFGFLSSLILLEFFDAEKLARLQRQIAAIDAGVVLAVGCGATLVCDGDILIYADLARWEAQMRFRRNEAGNLAVENRTAPPNLQYKRAYFVDWRVCDRWKRPLLGKCDFVLDTNDRRAPKLATGDVVRRGLRHAVTRPFRVVPFFDPAPWGGQWMKEVCDLDRSAPNYGWCFDCVPEENSLLLEFGNVQFEIPSINLVFEQPRALLGQAVHARFGEEFPIRFDFLDTMGGGNLSFQVHPLTEYIRQHFGMSYTQDESYYMLDAGPDAAVYLGLRDGIDSAAMARDLELAQTGAAPFPAERYANKWPVKKHDHFLIPAGTVHCSGANAMVLEISATPYIFTFKMWDWGRLGLDGKPRPIHLRHGLANIRWDHTTTRIQREMINTVSAVTSGDGWRQERTGLHEREFIETRRHWFTKCVGHDTQGTVNVLNLISGEEAIVESPTGAFEPFTIHYAETFIVPAAVGAYTIRPPPGMHGEGATMKAFVRS